MAIQMLLCLSHLSVMVKTSTENFNHIVIEPPSSSHFIEEMTAECLLLAPTAVQHSLNYWAGGRFVYMIFEVNTYKSI